jgi:hypothetical protein
MKPRDHAAADNGETNGHEEKLRRCEVWSSKCAASGPAAKGGTCPFNPQSKIQNPKLPPAPHTPESKMPTCSGR